MTTNTDDTICAISTPAGVGGIAVARISGPKAIEIVASVWQGKDLMQCPGHTAHLGLIVDPASPSAPLDQAVATIFRSPASFTGEDVVELSVHGSTFIQSQLINLLIRQGARMAEPGEFTRRAFAAGKMDLAEAEAVADVIASTSAASHRVAMTQMRGKYSTALNDLRDKLIEIASLIELELDFSEEDVEFADRSRLADLTRLTLDTVKQLAQTFSTGNAIKNGIPVAIIGKPNAGKSSILNLLVGDDRAIVSDIPGTTRDTIEDTATIGGVTYRFIDTAGLRTTTDAIENLGIDRAWQKASQASLVIWVIDASTAPTPTPSAAPLPSTSSTSCIVPLPTSSSSSRTVPLPTIDELSDFYTRLTTILSPNTPILILLNKSDLATPSTLSALTTALTTSIGSPLTTSIASNPYRILPFSALDGDLSLLTDAIVSLCGICSATLSPDAVIVTNSRHYQALQQSIAPLERVLASLSPASTTSFPSSTPNTPLSAISFNLPLDLVAQDLREAIHHLSTITGSITTPDLLSTIFSRFCIGK